MGIARAMAKMLMQEGKRRPYRGKILTAGRQDIYATEQQIRNWAADIGFKLSDGVKIEPSENEFFKDKKYISDESFFKLLGFNEVKSIDYSDYQKCSFVYDLNNPIPKELHNEFDLIYDGGTLEHIFNVPMVLKNLYSATKNGGRVIHSSPTSNYVDHGYYMFSPIFFTDYYCANKWDIINIYLFKQETKNLYNLFQERKWSIYAYEPGSIDTWIFGGYSGLYGTYCVLEKNEKTICEAIPYQGYYRDKIEIDIKNNGYDLNQSILNNKTFIQKIAFNKKYLGAKFRNKLRPLYLSFANLLPLKFHLKRLYKY